MPRSISFTRFRGKRRRRMSQASEKTEREPLNARLARAGYQIDSSALESGGWGTNIWTLRTVGGSIAVGKICPMDRGQSEFENMQKLCRSSFGERRQPPGLPRPIEFLSEIGMLIMERWKSRLAPAGRFTDETVAGVARLLAGLQECEAQPELRRSWRGIIRSMQRKVEQNRGLA